MFVLQILPALESGGVERGTLEIAAALIEAGHRAAVISAGGRLVAELEAMGCEHITLPVGRKSLASLSLVGRLRELFAARAPDIVHARSRIPAWLSWLAWRRLPDANRPHWLTTAHGFYSVGRYSAIMMRGERVIAVSRVIREYILEHYPGTDPALIRLIPRGVDTSVFRYDYQPDAKWLQAWRDDYPELRDKRVVTIAGRISSGKGHREFLRVLARGQRDRPDVAGLIVGQPGRRGTKILQDLKRLAAQLDIRTLVFAGERRDIREILAVSAVVTSFSMRAESFGRTVLEALSLGRPVVGFDHGGVGEILGELYPAGRVPPGDIEQAAGVLNKLLESPPPVPRDHPFTLKRMTDATLAVYYELAHSE